MEAQIIRPNFSARPLAWTSLSVGWFQQGRVCSSPDGTCWDFGGAPQFRGTLELPLGEAAAIGVAGTLARAPLIYEGTLVGSSSCAGCDADANVAQILGTLRLGSGGTFHQIIDISAGTTMYTNFRSTAGNRLGDGKTVSDLTFGIGYGFGYNITPRAQIMVILQEWALVLHERQPGRSENTTTQQSIRVGGRFALGERF